MCAGVASEDQEVHSTQKGERQARGQNIIYKYMRRLRYEVNIIYIYIYIYIYYIYTHLNRAVTVDFDRKCRDVFSCEEQLLPQAKVNVVQKELKHSCRLRLTAPAPLSCKPKALIRDNDRSTQRPFVGSVFRLFARGLIRHDAYILVSSLVCWPRGSDASTWRFKVDLQYFGKASQQPGKLHFADRAAMPD